MALIPGTLPSDTCYGTPQDLLELFAQYLDIPAVALQSKVFFGSSSTGLTSDSIWIDTTSATNPILTLNIGGTWTDYVKNYLNQRTAVTIASGDYLLISDVSDSNNTKKGLVSDIVTLAVPAAGSITYSMLSTSATESDNVAKRTAKAWVNFNGTGTPSIREDFNVSSITDNGTGDYTVNFSAALADANYAVFGSCENSAGAFNVIKAFTNGAGSVVAPTTTAVRFCTGNGTSNQDPSYVTIGVLR